MRKLLLLALSLLICLSATACVTIQTYNFGMAFAEIYATLDLDEIEPLTNGEAYESLAQALEFDRALAGLGEAEFVPLSSTAKEGGYEVRMRVNLTREGRTYSRIQTYRLTYGQWQGEQRVTAWELVGLQPFSGLPESGIRLFLEAAAEGDAARVAGLSDIWGFEAEERAELLQEICLALRTCGGLHGPIHPGRPFSAIAVFDPSGRRRDLFHGAAGRLRSYHPGGYLSDPSGGLCDL